MNKPSSNISRRGLLAAPLALAAVRAKPATLSELRSRGRKKHLAYLIGSEPESLDRAKFADVSPSASVLSFIPGSIFSILS